MSETVLVAIVAVIGTSAGAAISPLIGLIREIYTERGSARGDRLRAAAKVGECITKLARIAPDALARTHVMQAHTLTLEARFDLAQHLPKGAGQVDRFIEYSMAEIQKFKLEEPRLVAAEYASDRVMAWARGDIGASRLTGFGLERAGGEWIIV